MKKRGRDYDAISGQDDNATRGQDHNAARGRDWIWTIALVGVFIIGIGILLYPTVSNWWNGRVTSRAIAAYQSAVEDLGETDYSAYFEAAEEYNEVLAALGSASAITSPDLVDEDYWELLDVSGTGIMGYITIEKINVQLPIYHGTDEGVLQVGAGHLEGSSLPIGGESTHSVISAHRGLPSAKLFTDLDQLEEGDTFTITVLDRVLTYEVDQVTVVEPTDLENLYIEDGKDYCTLMTCTPYGINSHRLLVRGVRVETMEGAQSDGSDTTYLAADGMEQAVDGTGQTMDETQLAADGAGQAMSGTQQTTDDGSRMDTVYVIAIIVAAAAALAMLVLFIWMLMIMRRRKKGTNHYEEII